MWKVTVDKEKCTGDGECADVCPVDVYQLVEGRAEPVNEDDCLGCESCIEACDFDATLAAQAVSREGTERHAIIFSKGRKSEYLNPKF